MNPGNCSDDSDTSDEDYIPDGQVENLPSEEESDGEPEDDLKDDDGETPLKRNKSKQNSKRPAKKRKKTNAKKMEPVEEPEAEAPQQPDKLTEEEEKKKADSLWADFMSDTDFKPKPKPAAQSAKSGIQETKPEKPEQKLKVLPPKKVTIEQIFEFAGEEVKVTKEVAVDSAEARLLPKASGSASPQSSRTSSSRGRAGGLGGISSVLSQLGKKQKISVLEKSKLDWDGFKKDEDIDEELQRHNKGKDGYLERQDFLERADLRRFEIEKEIRTVQRSNRLM